MKREAWVGLFFSGWLVAAPAAAVPVPSPCEDRLPVILRVGLPQVGLVAALPAAEIRSRVERLFGQVYGEHGLCRESRRLQINVAVGNDYQIVDWLAQGRIDIGVTTDVGLHLLSERDGLNLFELDLIQSPEVAVFLPAFTQSLRSRTLASGRAVERPSPEADLDALFALAWYEGAASQAESPGGAALCATGKGGAVGKPAIRLEVPSHLSAAGFGTVVHRAEKWVEAAAAGLEGSARSKRREEFWARLLERTRFTFVRPPLEEPPVPGEIVIQSGEALSGGQGFRNHLVLPGRIAEQVLEPGSFRKAFVPPDALPSSWLTEGGAPRALRRWLDFEPYFGVRTYGFTVPESLALLAEHQRTSGVGRLALVLPGGGVKAVYQSALLDELYGRAQLRNAQSSGEGRFAAALPVDAVIGTSGGALLGYFVAKLGENGPWNLSRVLWEREPGVTLDSADIFDWGDLLRYLSAVVIYGVFCCCLALFSFQAARFARAEAGESYPSPRWRLSLLLWPILIATPLLVRAVNGLHAKEHIPAIEGLFYMVCASVAVFADQCIVERPTERIGPVPTWSPWWIIAAGCALVALPFVPFGDAAPGEGWHEQPLLFLGAFGPLLLLVLGPWFVLPAFRRRAWPESSRGRAVVSIAEILAALLFGIAVVALPAAVWEILDGVPFFLVGFGLVFLLLAFGPSLRRLQSLGKGLPLRHGARAAAYYGGLAVSTLLVLLLCRPSKASSRGGPVWMRESSIDLQLGGFLVCLGILTLLTGALVLVARSRRYHIEKAREFRSAFALSLSLVVGVYLVLLALRRILPERFSFLEMTSGFWIWLLGTSFVFSIAVVVAGAIVAVRNPRHRLIRGLTFLCSAHPNGIFFDRRFVRVALVSLGSLVWWNFVLAPALYGNARAREFLARGVHRFEEEAKAANRGVPPRLRTRFVAPANLLERDGTRYFLVQPPGGEGCQEIIRQPGSGSVWYQLKLEEEVRGERERSADSGCAVPVTRTPEQLQQVIFASGSPFPIFPAHLVDLPQEKEPVALVDGGYSNNVPVEAAAALAAAQVLIVQSSNLLGSPKAPKAPRDGWARFLPEQLHGPLVGDLSRLAGFLYERSQQPDRLSRREVFVVSLSPAPRDPWPELFDFRRSTVEGLRRCAQEDLTRRIGEVEGWGPPHFQLSVEVPPSKSTAG